MMLIQQVTHKYKQIPPNVRLFLLRILLLLIGWKTLYFLVLVPTGIPDDQLKFWVGWGSAKLLSLFYAGAHVFDDGYKVSIFIEGKRILGIAPACTGLELMALYIGVLLSIPTGSWKRILSFATIGILGIYLINVLRCALLVWIRMDHPVLFDFAHKWAFTLVVYFAIFYGWTLYLKKHDPQKS